MCSERGLLAGEANLARAGVVRVQGEGHDARANGGALCEELAGLSALDAAQTDVDVNLLVEDLTLVQQGLHRADAHEGAELVHLADRTVDDLIAVHGEEQGLESDLLIDRAIAVDDSATTLEFVIEGEQDVVAIIIEATFECIVCKTVDVVGQGLALLNVFRRDANRILNQFKTVHFGCLLGFTPQRRWHPKDGRPASPPSLIGCRLRRRGRPRRLADRRPLYERFAIQGIWRVSFWVTM